MNRDRTKRKSFVLPQAFLPWCAVPLGVLLLVACGDESRLGNGLIVDADGTMLANNAENNRLQAQRAIERGVDESAGPQWHTHAIVNEKPVYDVDAGEWRWQHVTVTVTLVGEGDAPPITDDEIRAAVVRYFRRGKLATPDVPVTVSVAHDRQSAAPMVANTPASSPPPALAAASSQHYRIQSGDTLMAISSAAYGTPQHWKAIIAANPGLDPARLTVGQDIVLPPLPAPSVSPAP